MILAFLASELVVRWAARQLLLATKIAQENKSKGYDTFVGRALLITNCHIEHHWTKTHGFFALMGGFMQDHDNGPPTVMEAKDVPNAIKKRILQVEIKDRSKGDGLSKNLPWSKPRGSPSSASHGHLKALP